MGQENSRSRGLTAEVEILGLDEALEKANRLVKLLQEAAAIIDLLAGEKVRNLTD